MKKKRFEKIVTKGQKKPKPRWGHVMVSDNKNTCYLFGGFYRDTFYSDFWSLNGYVTIYYFV